jgi:negative regulator of flagellin synthesis FlgM
MTRSLEAGSGNEAADVDTDKVAAIMKQIDNGTYKVNPEAIADAMLFDARSMVKR